MGLSRTDRGQPELSSRCPIAGKSEKTYHPFRAANAGVSLLLLLLNLLLRERNNDETRSVGNYTGRTEKPDALPEQPSVPTWSRKTKSHRVRLPFGRAQEEEVKCIRMAHARNMDIT